MPHQRTPRYTAWLMVLAILLATTVSVTAQSTYSITQLHIHPDAMAGPATVRTQVEVGPQLRTSSQGAWLARFTADPDGLDTVLSVTLSQVGSGWLGPMWGVQLHSDHGLISRRLAPQQGSGFTQGSTYLPLQTTALNWEHHYEIALGYDPDSGVAAVSVFDLTTQQWVLTRNLQLESYDGPLYAAAGVASVGAFPADQSPVAHISSFAVEPGVRPARMSWWLMQRDRPEVPFSSTQRVDRGLESVISAHLPWEVTPGALQFRLVNGAGETVRTVTGVGEEQYVPIRVGDLPGGEYTGVMEYVHHGDTWVLDERPFTVGVASVGISSIQVAAIDKNEARIEGTLQVTSDGPLEEMTVGLSGQLVRHTFEMDPDGSRGRTHKVPFDMLVLDVQSLQPDGTHQVAFTGSVSIPERAESAGWELRAEPFAMPEQYVTEPQPTSVWVIEPEYDLDWLGFLDHEEAELVQWVPGVDVLSLSGRLPAGPVNMYLVAIDVTRPELSIDALVGSQATSESARWPRDQVGAMVQQSGALMGINSAFFDISNTQNPTGMVIQSGQLLKSGTRSTVAFDADNKPYLGSWMWLGSVRRPDGTASRSVVGLNETNMSTGIGLYRAPALRTPGSSSPGMVELVLSDVVEEDDPSSDSMDRIVRGVVTEVREGQPGVALDPGIAVLAGSGLSGTYLKETYAVGDEVQVVYRLLGSTEGPDLTDWRDINAAVSGGVILVRQGRLGDSAVQTNHDRHPRTALGISEDQSTLYWLLVDGRSQVSVGMTYMDMARFFQHIGAYHAINLDGGGSSTLAAWDFEQERVVVLNVPSDGNQRYVPDGIGLFHAGE